MSFKTNGWENLNFHNLLAESLFIIRVGRVFKSETSLTRVKNHNGQMRWKNDMEIMMHSEGFSDHLNNCFVSFAHCDFPRAGVETLDCCQQTFWPDG